MRLAFCSVALLLAACSEPDVTPSPPETATVPPAAPDSVVVDSLAGANATPGEDSVTIAAPRTDQVPVPGDVYFTYRVDSLGTFDLDGNAFRVFKNVLESREPSGKLTGETVLDVVVKGGRYENSRALKVDFDFGIEIDDWRGFGYWIEAEPFTLQTSTGTLLGLEVGGYPAAPGSGYSWEFYDWTGSKFEQVVDLHVFDEPPQSVFEELNDRRFKTPPGDTVGLYGHAVYYGTETPFRFAANGPDSLGSVRAAPARDAAGVVRFRISEWFDCNANSKTGSLLFWDRPVGGDSTRIALSSSTAIRGISEYRVSKTETTPGTSGLELDIDGQRVYLRRPKYEELRSLGLCGAG